MSTPKMATLRVNQEGSVELLKTQFVQEIDNFHETLPGDLLFSLGLRF